VSGSSTVPPGATRKHEFEILEGALVSDVWSAACVLLALHGQHPFDGLEVPAVLWKLGNDFPPGNLPPSALEDLLHDVFVPAHERPSAALVLQRLDAVTRDALRGGICWVTLRCVGMVERRLFFYESMKRKLI
jgi:hypothetical protein